MPLTNFPGGVSSFGFPLVGSGNYVTSGKAWFVNSLTGLNNPGRGLSPDSPFATVEYATTKARSAKGDYIFVMPGHTETISATGAWVGTATGVSIVGLGNRSSRPIITFATATTAQISIANGGVTLENMVFDLTGIDAVAAAFLVGQDFTCRNCRILQSGASAQATKCFTVAGARPQFLGVEINASGGAGAASAIEPTAAVDGMVVSGCYIYGDFYTAPITNASTFHFTNMLIDDNFIIQQNGTAKKIAVLTSGSTGMISRNRLGGTTWATAADAFTGVNIQLRYIQNFGFDDIASVSGVLVPAVGTLS